MNPLDRSTLYAGRALDIVLIKYPARTGLGVVIGLSLHFLAQCLEPTLRSIPHFAIADLAWWQWLAPGLLIMHLPTIASLFKQNSIGNDQVDQALELIAKGNFTHAERRQQYRLLINRVLDREVQVQTSSGNLKTD
jgi:hypothetical protein